ncbi:MAG: DUF6447 family protein [Gammaproteobacteria bacterium SHHR-1]
MSDEPMLQIDDKSFKIADLSETARSLVQSIQIVDAEIARLNTQGGIAQTARAAYMRELKGHLPS